MTELYYEPDSDITLDDICFFHTKFSDITSLDFSPTEQKLVVSDKGDNISLYNSFSENRPYITFHLSFCGVNYVCFTDKENKILIATKNIHVIYEFNINENNIEFEYLGHSKPIISLQFNQKKNYFLSQSLEEKLCIVWDYNKKVCICKIYETIWSTFDYYCDFIGVIQKSNSILFFPLNIKENKLPTKVITTNLPISKIKTDNNNKYIFCLAKNKLLVYQFMEGKLLKSFCNSKNEEINDFDFSCDLNFLILNSINSITIKLMGLDFTEKSSVEKKITKNKQILFSKKYLLLAFGGESLGIITHNINK